MKTKILIPRSMNLAAAAIREFKARTLGLLTLACLLAAPATAQVNYAISGSTAYVTSSPNASGDVVIASTFNGYPVTSIGTFAFLRCTSLTNVTIPNSVTSIGAQAFNGCGSLTSVIIPDSVTSMGAEAFYFCTSLTNVIIGNSVASIGFYVFRDCRSLTSVTIPNSVTAIGYGAFQNCTRLNSMTIPNSVTYIEQYAFSGCTSLTNVIIGNSVASIGVAAFQNCTGLTSVTIPNSVTSIAALAFFGCTNVTNFSVEATNPAYSSLNGVWFDKAQTTLIKYPAARAGSYVIPDSVTNIGERVFENCTSLTSVTIPNGVVTIGGAAFYRCTSLTSATIPDSVTQIGTGLYAGNPGAFAYCTSLTSVIIGHGVTNIGSGAFSACSNLTRLTIPASVINLGFAAFYGSSRLTNFTFLGNAPRRIFDMDGGFAQFDSVGAGAKVYYYCGTTGWGATYGGLPTVMLCPPQVAPGSAGVKPGGFGFTLTRLTNQTIVVEASTNLVNWQPIWTNTVPGASAEFVDPEWLQQPNRFYRARSD